MKPEERAPLLGRHPAPVPSFIVAFVSALLVHLASAGGLFHYFPHVQTVLVVGAVAGLALPDPKRAAAAAALATTAGWLLRPAGQALGAAVGAAAIAAAVALLGARLARARPAAIPAASWCLAGLVILNLWASGLTAARTPFPDGRTLYQHLAEEPRAGQVLTDPGFYQRVYWLMRDGTGYYDAYERAYAENALWRGEPGEVFGYHLPTRFWLWQALPDGLPDLVAAMLVVASLAAAASFGLGMLEAPPPTALVGAVAVCGYYLYVVTQPTLLLSEPWVGALVVLAAYASVMSFRSANWRAWLAGAVALGMLAFALRELSAFVLLAGFASSIYSHPAERKTRMLAWGGAAALAAAAYLAHIAAVGPRVSHLGGASWLRGGPYNVFLAIVYGDKYLGVSPWVPLALAALGLAGVLTASRAGERVFLGVVSLLPLASFLVIGNAALDVEGRPMNYWGVLVVPLLFALSPWASARLSGAVRASMSCTGAPRGRWRGKS